MCLFLPCHPWYRILVLRGLPEGRVEKVPRANLTCSPSTCPGPPGLAASALSDHPGQASKMWPQVAEAEGTRVPLAEEQGILPLESPFDPTLLHSMSRGSVDQFVFSRYWTAALQSGQWPDKIEYLAPAQPAPGNPAPHWLWAESKQAFAHQARLHPRLHTFFETGPR